MDFPFRWQAATLLLTIGMTLPTSLWGEEFCPECAQKVDANHFQKHGGGKGYHGGKGISQKGHYQKGVAQKSYGHHVKEHKWFFSEHPPAVPIFTSAAIQRVALPQQVNFRIQQEAGELRPEAGRPPKAEAGSPPADTNDLNKRLTVLEAQVSRLHDSLEKLVDQLQK